MYRTILFFVVIGNSFFSNAQPVSKVFIGGSVPDNISNRYLIPGAYISYGRNFKISKKIFLNTELSASYNSKNSDYRVGFDDDPYYDQFPMERDYAVRIWRKLDFDPYEKMQLYVFSPSLGVNLEYSPLYGKSDSPYLKGRISLNYSFTEDIVDVFVYNEESEMWDRIRTGGKESSFKIGFSGGLGYEFKSGQSKPFFFETEYKIFPSIMFGRNDDRVGLFIIKVGMGF